MQAYSFKTSRKETIEYGAQFWGQILVDHQSHQQSLSKKDANPSGLGSLLWGVGLVHDLAQNTVSYGVFAHACSVWTDDLRILAFMWTVLLVLWWCQWCSTNTTHPPLCILSSLEVKLYSSNFCTVSSIFDLIPESTFVLVMLKMSACGRHF